MQLFCTKDGGSQHSSISLTKLGAKRPCKVYILSVFMKCPTGRGISTTSQTSICLRAANYKRAALLPRQKTLVRTAENRGGLGFRSEASKMAAADSAALLTDNINRLRPIACITSTAGSTAHCLLGLRHLASSNQ